MQIPLVAYAVAGPGLDVGEGGALPAFCLPGLVAESMTFSRCCNTESSYNSST